jgi:hypothetical protein
MRNLFYSIFYSDWLPVVFVLLAWSGIALTIFYVVWRAK